MKILFTVTCYGRGGFTGKGGHYYSLVTIANELKNFGINCHILTMGTSESDVIVKSGISNSFIRFNGLDLWTTRNKLKTLIIEKKFNIVHSFDYSSYIICSRLRINLVFTKCGGQSPNSTYPIPPSLILFSDENLMYFKNNSSYERTKLTLIPNRVSSFNISQDRAESLKDKLMILSDEIVIMRIARISIEYMDGILQTLRLSKLIREKFGKKSRTVIIGKKQSESCFNEILNSLTEYDSIVTDDKYTFNSKELLGISNIVVATGRGVMEACSLGKNIFIPVRKENGEFPVHFCENSFDKLFFYNFSQRNPFITNINETCSVLTNILDLKESHFSKSAFKKYFDVKMVGEKYLKVYEQSSFNQQILNTYLCEIKLLITNFKKFYLFHI